MASFIFKNKDARHFIAPGVGVSQALALALLGTFTTPLVFGSEAEKADPSMLKDCVQLARLLNKSGKVNINENEVTPLYTWRAGCAERPPSGEGKVMALCEGISVRSDGKAELLFFWSKTHAGTLGTGYFSCGP